MFKVQRRKCDQCLFSKNKIVSDARRKQIIRDSLAQNTFFSCHKTQVKGIEDQVCCRGFWEKFAHEFNLGRISQRMGWVEEVEV